MNYKIMHKIGIFEDEYQNDFHVAKTRLDVGVLSAFDFPFSKIVPKCTRYAAVVTLDQTKQYYGGVGTKPQKS